MRNQIIKAAVVAATLVGVLTVTAPADAALKIDKGRYGCSPRVWGVHVAYEVCEFQADDGVRVQAHVYNRQPHSAHKVQVYLATRHSNAWGHYSDPTKYSWGSTYTVPAHDNLEISRTYTMGVNIESELMIVDASTNFWDRPFVLQTCYGDPCTMPGGVPKENATYKFKPFF